MTFLAFECAKFGNNVAKFILSIGPQTTKEKGVFQIDLEDDAVQNMLITYAGEARFPDKITPFNPPPPPVKAEEELVEKSAEELLAEADAIQRSEFVKNAGVASVAALGLLAFGLNADGEESTSLLATFALAGLAGYQVVWGVAPALHSPLMAVTNAISGACFSFARDFFPSRVFETSQLSTSLLAGMTALGGMLLLANDSTSSSLVPDTPAHWMGAIATVLSFVNIVGGFLISGKMLDLFKRPEDPKDYFELYAVPSAILLTGLAAGYASGNLDTMSGSVAIAAAICSIGASEWTNVRIVNPFFLRSLCRIRSRRAR